MKKTNKLLEIIPAILMVLTTVPFAFAAECEPSEHDVLYNGFCKLCKAFVGPEIKAGETHKYDNGLFEYVKFVPVVDGTYIISADAPEYSYIDLYKEVDGKLKGIAFVAIDSANDKLALSYDYTAGETYYFICSNFAGEFFEYVTLSCETHQGTKQTCYGYVCDACGEYFGVALGHDIVVDEYVAPACTETGLTAGQHCSRCDDMTVAQEVIPALGHINEDGNTTCDRCGETILCEDCGRPVHAEEGIPQYICWLISIIKMIVSFFK